MSSRRHLAFGDLSVCSSRATAKQHVPTIEVDITDVDATPSSSQYVLAIKVSIAVPVHPSLTPEAVVIIVAVAPPAIARDVKFDDLIRTIS